MSDTQAMARLFAYSEWANHRFLDAVAPLDAETFGRDLKGSHGGIRGPLVPTHGAEGGRHQRSHGASPPALPGEDQTHAVKTLRERWTELEAERRVWLAGLEPGAGERVIEYRTFKGD